MKKIVICDSHDFCDSSKFDIIILWKKYRPSNSGNMVFSIPEILEEKPDIIRNLYLDWFHGLSKKSVKGTTLDNFLSFKQFDFWATSEFVENAILESSPHIDNAIRILALMHFLKSHCSHDGFSLSIHSKDKLLVQCFPRRARVRHRLNILPGKMSSPCKFSYNSLIVALNKLKGFFWLFKSLLEGIQFDRSQLKRWMEVDSDNIFVSYFCNFGSNIGGQFGTRSKYWMSLQDKIFETKGTAKWLYLYFKNPQIKTIKEANRIINELNDSTNQTHACVNSCFDINLACKTLKVYLKATQLISSFNPEPMFKLSSLVNIWPLYKQSWNNSFYGSSLMSVIASNIMFTKMFNGFKSKKLVYLQENQAWQVSMLQAWNNTEKNHPRTSIGFPHATISFWDLRYHFHKDILEDDCEYKRYLPDLIAISGKLNKKSLKRSHVPSKRLVEVEALRYLYLQKSGVDSLNIGAVDLRNEALNASKNKDLKINLLILTDYSQQRSISLLEMISQLPSKIVNKYNIRIRCHPASPIPSRSKLRKQFEFSDSTLVDLVSWSSIVITSSTTSSSVDALCNNKKVLIFVSPDFVNPSPLYPSTSITWVHGLTELKHVLNSKEFSTSDMKNAEDYFFLESTLPRWSRLLGLDC